VNSVEKKTGTERNALIVAGEFAGSVICGGKFTLNISVVMAQ